MNIGNRPRTCSVLSAVLALSTVGGPPVASGSSPISLDVPGRADATPWVAASGSLVAVAWGATGGGKTDVFLAVSRDGGSTFGSPVQVNVIAGEARLGGELPPRVAVVPRRGAPMPEIVVQWTARGNTTEIKDESVNGRRVAAVRELRLQPDRAPAFGNPVTLSPNGPAMYPVLAATNKGLVAVWATGGDPSRVEARTLPMP